MVAQSDLPHDLSAREAELVVVEAYGFGERIKRRGPAQYAERNLIQCF